MRIALRIWLDFFDRKIIQIFDDADYLEYPNAIDKYMHALLYK
jgi:hypothetical protein